MKWAISLLVAVGLIWIGWRVLPVLVTLHVIVCFVLIIVIMLQSGSAADLAGAFGGAGSQTAFGPRGATSFLSRATTWCAIVFMLTSLALSIKRAPGTGNTGSILEDMSNPAPGKTPAPAPGKTPTTIPAAPAPAQSTPTSSAPVLPSPMTPAPAAPPTPAKQ
jgi:preprotein translocase subunit SecG